MENLDIYDIEKFKKRVQDFCMVSEDIRLDRLSVCSICMQNEDDTCNLCGCDINIKTYSKIYKCKFWKK